MCRHLEYSFLTVFLEPDSLANLVTNMAVPKCAGAHNAYLECTDYAVTQLNLANVAMYLDAGKYISSFLRYNKSKKRWKILHMMPHQSLPSYILYCAISLQRHQGMQSFLMWAF